MIPSSQKTMRRQFKEDELHIAVLTGRLKRVREFLRRGVHIESVNADGQTPLFCASFGGDLEVVDLLLRLGANPNKKCGSSGASPVHAAAFRGSRRVLRLLVEYGGDLFARDVEFLTPREYALRQKAPIRQQKIIEFLDFLESMVLDSMGQGQEGATISPAVSVSTILSEQSSGTLKTKKNLFSSQLSLSRKVSPSTSNIWATCIGDTLTPTANLITQKFPVRDVKLTENLHKSVSCHLLNNLCVTTSLPLLSPTQLHRPKVPTTAYTCGGPTVYSQYTWLGTSVTVRRPTPMLSMDKNDYNGIDDIASDPEAIKCLLQELSLLRRLRHPSFIEVMAACHVSSPSPAHVTLVYQHVPYGSLYHHIHVQHHDLLVGSIVDILIELVEALLFMHAHGWLHCGLSSHAIHLVSLRSAKLGCFEYAIESQVKGVGMRAQHLSKATWLKPWQAPETIVEDMVSVRSEIYSIAVIMWEIWAGMAPWFGVDDSEVARRIKDGEILPELNEVPSLISYLTQYGLKWNEHEREIDLEEIHTLLKSLRVKCKEDDRVPSITSWGPPSIPNTPVVGRLKMKPPDIETTSDSSKESQNDLRLGYCDGYRVAKGGGKLTSLGGHMTVKPSHVNGCKGVKAKLATQSSTSSVDDIFRDISNCKTSAQVHWHRADSGFCSPDSRTPSPLCSDVAAYDRKEPKMSTPNKPLSEFERVNFRVRALSNISSPSSPDLQSKSDCIKIKKGTTTSLDFVKCPAKRAFLQSGNTRHKNGTATLEEPDSIPINQFNKGSSMQNIHRELSKLGLKSTGNKFYVTSSMSLSLEPAPGQMEKTVGQIIQSFTKKAESYVSTGESLLQRDIKTRANSMGNINYRSESKPPAQRSNFPSKFKDWDEIKAIKPASHQTIRHSSSCSLACGPSTSYSSGFHPKSKEVSQRSYTLDSRFGAASRMHSLPSDEPSRLRIYENARPKYRKYKRRNNMEVNDDFIDDEFNLSLFEQPHMQLSVTSFENLLDEGRTSSSVDLGSSSSNEDDIRRVSSRNRSTSEEDKIGSKDNDFRLSISKNVYFGDRTTETVPKVDSHQSDALTKEGFAKEKNLSFKAFYNGKTEQESSGESDSDLFKPLKSLIENRAFNSIKRNLEKNVSAYLPSYSFYTDSEGENS